MAESTLLFRKCLGLNDSRAFGTQKMVTDLRDISVGSVELIDCLNLTTTPDGCLEKVAPLVTVIDTGAAITNLSAGSRLLFNDGTNTKELTTLSTIVNRFPSVSGPTTHTPLDVRVSGAATVYKSVNPATAMTEAVVGSYVGPPVSKTFSAMPTFDHAFVHNSRLYAVNTTDKRFLQYSEDYAYDLWAAGDDFIGSIEPVLQAGSIPNTVITTHNNGVSVYIGSGPHDFVKKFYPCSPIDNTLYSGFISKIYGNSHVFLCDDGVYTVAQDGSINNTTVSQIDHMDAFNTLYYCSTIQDGKYLAFGDKCCVEYDFRTKTVLKRASFGVKGACVWNGVNYFASGNNIATLGTEIDTTAHFACSMTFPYSDLGIFGTKSLEAFYFTGTLIGDATITVTDQNQESWVLEVSAEWINVSDMRIKTPRRMMGNHVSIKIECTSGAFRMEELRAVLSGSTRSR